MQNLKKYGPGFVAGGLFLVFLTTQSPSLFLPKNSGVSSQNRPAPDRAMIEIAPKMESPAALIASRRSMRSEIRLMLDTVIQEAQRAENDEVLTQRWQEFASSEYARSRAINVGTGFRRGQDLIYPVSYGGEKVEINFNALPNGYASRIHILESRPEPVLPFLPSPVRSEARTSISYNHSPSENRYSTQEVVSLAPLGLNQFLSPFEISVLKAFLYRDYKRQPFLNERHGNKDVFRRFQGEISKAEADAFFQTLYEIQERVRLETGRAFDPQAIMDRLRAFYQKEVSGYDQRPVQMKTESGEMEIVPRAFAIMGERKIWPEIFEDLLRAVMLGRSAQSPFIPAGLVELDGKHYVQVISGTTMKLQFIKGGFPEKGISLLLGGGQHEVRVTLEKGVIRFHYEQDASQARVFDKLNASGLLNGHVGIGSAPETATDRGALITLPASEGIALQHAIFALTDEAGIVTVRVTDGRGGRGRPSGKMTLIEYPALETVKLPHLRLEVRKDTPQDDARDIPSGFEGMAFSQINPDQMEPKNRITALARGVVPNPENPDFGAVESYAKAFQEGLPENTFAGLSKKYPVLESSENPGALVLVTAQIPDEKELIAIRALLLTQKKQFFRIVLPVSILSPQEAKALDEKYKNIFGPMQNEIGKRFKIMPIQNSRQLQAKVAQDIYNAMLEGKIQGVKSLPDLTERYMLQWVDESAKNFQAAESGPSRQMTSNIGADSGYSELMLWGAAHAMKMSQGIEASKLRQEVVALIQNGKRIEYRVSDALRGLVSGFLKALQTQIHIEKSA